MLRNASYHGLCKGNVALRGAFAVSSDTFQAVPLSVLFALKKPLYKPQHFDKKKTKDGNIKIARRFVESIWQLLFDCSSDAFTLRVCIMEQGDAAAPLLVQMSRKRGGSLILEILKQFSEQ